MNAETVTSKFQIVIPEKIRKEMGIQLGHRFEVIRFDGFVRVSPDSIRIFPVTF